MRAECILLKFSWYYSDRVGESLKFVQKGKKGKESKENTIKQSTRYHTKKAVMEELKNKKYMS